MCDFCHGPIVGATALLHCVEGVFIDEGEKGPQALRAALRNRQAGIGMTKSVIFTALAGVSCLALAGPAAAQGWSSGFYARADVGFGFDGVVDIDAPNILGSLDGTAATDDSLIYGLGFGYRTLTGLRFEARVHNSFADLALGDSRVVLPDGQGLPPGTVFEATGDIQALALELLNIKDFNDEGRLQPYIGGGFGVTRLRANAANLFSLGPNPVPLNGFDDSDTNFTRIFVLGASYLFTPKFSAELGYRWRRVDDFDFEPRNGAPFLVSPAQTDEVDGDFETHQLTLGFRWHFNGDSLPTGGGARAYNVQALGAITGRPSLAANGDSGIGVNALLWRAALDVVSFMPLDSVDPFGGVIISDWYAEPSQPNERFKLNVLILDTKLRADGINVALFKQVNAGGVWTDAPVDPATTVQLENAILARARELRLASIDQ